MGTLANHPRGKQTPGSEISKDSSPASETLLPLPTDTEDQLWNKVHVFTKEKLGVTSMLFGFSHTRHAPKFIGTRAMMMRHSYPDDYMAHFSADKFLDDDLCALLLADNLGPHFWADIQNAPSARPHEIARALKDEALGMNVGVSIGFHLGTTDSLGGIGLAACGMSPGEFAARWATHEHEVMAYLQAFAPLMHARMVQARLHLTPRQKQVLTLSIAGMIGKEIAAQLKISEKRVARILEEVRERLQAETSLEAAAKAIIYHQL